MTKGRLVGVCGSNSATSACTATVLSLICSMGKFEAIFNALVGPDNSFYDSTHSLKFDVLL